MITAATISFVILLVAWLFAPAEAGPSTSIETLKPEGTLAEAA